MGTFSTNLLLSILAFGESAANGFDNWGESANFNFNRLDAKLGNKTTHSLAAGDVTLSATAESSLFVALTGTIIADRTVNISDRPGFWMFSNETTGSFSVTLLPSGGTGVVIPEGISLVYSDGDTPVLIEGGGGGETSEVIHDQSSFTITSGSPLTISGIDSGFSSIIISGECTSVSSAATEVTVYLSVGSGGNWFDIPGVSTYHMAQWVSGGSTTARRFIARLENLDDPASSIFYTAHRSNTPPSEINYFITPAEFVSRPIDALRFRVVTTGATKTVNFSKLHIVGHR